MIEFLVWYFGIGIATTAFYWYIDPIPIKTYRDLFTTILVWLIEVFIWPLHVLLNVYDWFQRYMDKPLPWIKEEEK